MKKHLNLATLVMVALVIAAVAGHAKGIPTPSAKLFGFSSGG